MGKRFLDKVILRTLLLNRLCIYKEKKNRPITLIVFVLGRVKKMPKKGLKK